MFSQTPSLRNNEKIALDHFRDNSAELKELRRLNIICNKEDMSNIMTKIESATSFTQILDATNRLDTENTNDPTVKSLGRTGMNIIFFAGSLVSNEASFGYYLLHFREKAIEFMADNGYSNNNPPRNHNENRM